MPASYLHQSVVTDAIGVVPAALAGGEGPDLFFFTPRRDQKGVFLPRLGSTLHHERTGDFLCALIKNAQTPVQRDYALGFLCHYATDTTFHPFVYAHSLRSDGTFSSTVHCTLEHTLDLWLYKQRTGRRDTPQHMTGFRAMKSPDRAQVAQLLSLTLAQVFPEFPVHAALCRRVFSDCVLTTRLLASPHGVKYCVLGAIAAPLRLRDKLHAHMVPHRLPEYDAPNACRQPWRSPFEPDGPVRFEGVKELYDAAVARAKEYIAAARTFWDGARDEAALRCAIGSNSYDSGLPCREKPSGT